ncbi:MAG: hypothetical protein ACTSRA_08020 [Promethearchaeota archaeon]
MKNPPALTSNVTKLMMPEILQTNDIIATLLKLTLTTRINANH